MTTALLATMLLAAASSPAAPTRTFEVGGRELTGQDITVCKIRGQWADGDTFVYQAWDACEKLSIEHVPAGAADEVVEQVHGIDRTFVIPAGNDSFLIGNEYSVVRLFRDRDGRTEEILISD